jgi:hypothetical protein
MTCLEARTKAFGMKSRLAYTARLPLSVTKPRERLNYSPYLPAAGLYSLFSDSFGPVP